MSVNNICLLLVGILMSEVPRSTSYKIRIAWTPELVNTPLPPPIEPRDDNVIVWKNGRGGLSPRNRLVVVYYPPSEEASKVAAAVTVPKPPPPPVTTVKPPPPPVTTVKPVVTTAKPAVLPAVVTPVKPPAVPAVTVKLPAVVVPAVTTVKPPAPVVKPAALVLGDMTVSPLDPSAPSNTQPPTPSGPPRSSTRELEVELI